MAAEVSLFFGQLANILQRFPFVSVIGTTLVFSFFLRAMKEWKGG